MSGTTDMSVGGYYVNMVGNNSYRVSLADANVEEEAEPVRIKESQDKVLSELELNKLLAPYGVKAVNGKYQSSDGFELSTGAKTQVVTEYGGAPPLPDVSDQVLDATILGARVAWMAQTPGISDAALMWVALVELARTAMRDVKDASDIKHAFQRSKLLAKDVEIAAQKRSIEAQRDAAKEQFVVSVIVAVGSAAISMAGASMASTTTGAMTAATFGSGVGMAFQTWYTMESKNYGSQRIADDQQLKAKRFEKETEALDMNIEEAKTNYEEAKEIFKLALRALQTHEELMTQATQRLQPA